MRTKQGKAPDGMADGADRAGGGRRRPFSTWVKKLTNFKHGGSSSSAASSAVAAAAAAAVRAPDFHLRIQGGRSKAHRSKNNNPYPQSGRVGPSGGASASAAPQSVYSYSTAAGRSRRSSVLSEDVAGGGAMGQLLGTGEPTPRTRSRSSRSRRSASASSDDDDDGDEDGAASNSSDRDSRSAPPPSAGGVARSVGAATVSTMATGLTDREGGGVGGGGGGGAGSVANRSINASLMGGGPSGGLGGGGASSLLTGTSRTTWGGGRGGQGAGEAGSVFDSRGTAGGGAGSTFSSPAPSIRSLTTTLTTIQSMPLANGGAGAGGGGAGHGLQSSSAGGNGSNHAAAGHHGYLGGHSAHGSLQVNGGGHHSAGGGLTTPGVLFSQPFPSTATTSPPSAIPAHLFSSSSSTGAGATGNGSMHPVTYTIATANNLLTDNASILTLASSSKRRRRRGSIDTDASVRAIPPSSLWGGSRESLPLSVLSASVDVGGPTAAAPPTPSLPTAGSSTRIAGNASVGAPAPAGERSSIYSATNTLPPGVVAAATQHQQQHPPSERNSFYYARQSIGAAAAGDAASVRSGLLGHGRTDSVSGSIGGGGGGVLSPSPTAPAVLESPREHGSDDDDDDGGARGDGDGGAVDQGDGAPDAQRNGHVAPTQELGGVLAKTSS